jgi:alpha-ketoglutarate-dependent taurine dioxygenase
MKIEKPDPRIGAIATDVDVRTMSEADWNALYQAWLDGIVLAVRGQELTIEDFLAYSRRFGRVKAHRVRRTRHPDHPEVTVMGIGTKKADGTVDKTIYDRGGGWHTDSPWDQDICKGTQLYALAIPSYGGDTLFASMYEAYDTLPEPLKKRIQGLRAEHVYGGRSRRGNSLLEPEDRNLPPAIHPIVRVHEETGRTSLYANPTHIVRVQGMSDSESETLIAELVDHMVKTEVQYRHKWQKGDIVIWDNRCALHSATGGYPIEEKRIHWRTTIMQDAVAAQRAA